MSANFNFGGPNTSGFKFDLGSQPMTTDILYNAAGNPNFGYMWQSVMNQLGATNPSSNWYKFLQNYMPTMKSQLGVWQMDNPQGRTQDYMNLAVPKLGEQYSLLNAEDRGANPRAAGTPRFLA